MKAISAIIDPVIAEDHNVKKFKKSLFIKIKIQIFERLNPINVK